MPPEQRRQEFLRFSASVGALQFGSFTLKSGRVSPYFFNSGAFHTGAQLERLGEFYAAVIAEAAPGATIVFGPAYKGIPLCVAAATALERRTGRETGFLFNRKVEKTHGDSGMFVGQPPGPGDRLVLVDDVITDGGTKLEAVALLGRFFPNPVDALVIAFDRMERSTAERNAIRDFEAETGIGVHPIVTLADLENLIAHPHTGGLGPGLPPDLLAKIGAYREKFGVNP